MFTDEEIKLDPVLKYFSFAHLKYPLLHISKEHAVLAKFIIDNTPRNPERTVALRKLLEAKDAAVRAALG